MRPLQQWRRHTGSYVLHSSNKMLPSFESRTKKRIKVNKRQLNLVLKGLNQKKYTKKLTSKIKKIKRSKTLNCKTSPPPGATIIVSLK